MIYKVVRREVGNEEKGSHEYWYLVMFTEKLNPVANSRYTVATTLGGKQPINGTDDWH